MLRSPETTCESEPGEAKGGTGQSPEGDQEHPGSGKGSWVAGTEGCREPLGEGGGEAKQQEGHGKLLASATPACSVALPAAPGKVASVWPTSGGAERMQS